MLIVLMQIEKDVGECAEVLGDLSRAEHKNVYFQVSLICVLPFFYGDSSVSMTPVCFKS